MKKEDIGAVKFSKWLKLMESKKNLFELEDEVDRLSKKVKNKNRDKK